MTSLFAVCWKNSSSRATCRLWTRAALISSTKTQSCRAISITSLFPFHVFISIVSFHYCFSTPFITHLEPGAIMELVQDTLEAASGDSITEKLQSNRAIAILDAAAKGKYGVPAVVVVRLHHPLTWRLRPSSPLFRYSQSNSPRSV